MGQFLQASCQAAEEGVRSSSIAQATDWLRWWLFYIFQYLLPGSAVADHRNFVQHTVAFYLESVPRGGFLQFVLSVKSWFLRSHTELVFALA